MQMGKNVKKKSLETFQKNVECLKKSVLQTFLGCAHIPYANARLRDVKWPSLVKNRQYFDAFLMPVFASSEM